MDEPATGWTPERAFSLFGPEIRDLRDLISDLRTTLARVEERITAHDEYDRAEFLRVHERLTKLEGQVGHLEALRWRVIGAASVAATVLSYLMAYLLR